MRFSLSLLLLAISLSGAASEQTEPVRLSDLADIRIIADNPALAPIFQREAPALFSLGGRVYVDDSDRLLDKLLEAQELGLELERSTRGLLLLPGQEQALIDHLKDMDGRVTTTSAGINASLFLPREDYALQFNFHVGGRGAGTFQYDPEDENTLRFAATNHVFNSADLKSRVVVSGVVITDLGATYARKLNPERGLQWGATLKYQHINLIERLVVIDEYEEDRLFDRHRDIKDYYHPNLDLGLNWQRGALGLSASALNLHSKDFTGPENSTYHLRPTIKLAASYRQGWGGFALHWDALPDEGFGVSEDLQLLKLRTHAQLLERLTLEFGYNIVQEGQNDNTVEAGLRYQLGELFIQAHGLIAGRREFGGGFQVQLVF